MPNTPFVRGPITITIPVASMLMLMLATGVAMAMGPRTKGVLSMDRCQSTLPPAGGLTAMGVGAALNTLCQAAAAACAVSRHLPTFTQHMHAPLPTYACICARL